jgi:iron complex outermembrane receptor protein
MKERKLRLFVLFMSFALIFSGGTVVLAQEVDEDTGEFLLEEVIVTGSRIERSDVTSVSPISVFSEEDIRLSGQVTLEDFVQNLPSVAGGFMGSTINNISIGGTASASLRGLGSNRTLVLLNGQRMPSAGENGFVDLNMIPAGIVERVEVLRDGASTVYGSDAIAGVVNFITKRDFEGAEFQFQYDITDENDGAIYQTSALFGGGSDRGHVVFGVDYTKRDPIWQKDRDFSKCPFAENPDGSLYCTGSGTCYPGHIYSDTYPDHILDNGVIVPFDWGVHAYNFATQSYMVTPQTVLSTYASGRYDLVQESAFGSVTAIGDFLWTNRQSDQLMAAVGTFWAPLVPATNPYNPTGEDAYVARRLVETGGRHFTQDAASWRLVTGLEGEFNNGWNWDITYNYSRWLDSQIVYGQANKVNFANVLDPDLCAADPACPGVWDPFRVDTLTEDLQNYVLANHSPVQRSKMKTLQINLTGDLGDFVLPGGPVQWAVGFENRKEEALFQPDAAAAMDLIYYVAPDRTEGEYSVDELYGEVRVPILEEKPFADILAAEISVRRSDYSNLDDATTNWKYALEWGPIRALRFRTVYSEGFRGADIAELYGPQQLSANNYNDPCINYGTGADATVAANCAADGLPPDFTQGTTQATSVLGGNPDLKPEEAESLTFGVVIAPENLPLTVSVDYFNIEITDAIGTAGTDSVITGCYASPNFSSPWCDLIAGPTHPLVGEAPHPTSPYRNSLGAVSGVLLTNANLADYETEGVDFAVNYVWEFDDYNSLNLSMMGTYLTKYDYTPFEGGDVVELAGFFGEDQWLGTTATFNEWKVNFSFQYVTGDWSFTWAPRWFDSTMDLNADASNAVNKAKAIWYHDVQATYNYKDWSFALGIRNLLDEDPPYVSNYDDMNTVNASYDTAGRYLYARATFRF